MYRAGLESMLGLRRRGATFSVEPCIPSSWPEYEIVWRFFSTRYEITVANPQRRCRGVVRAELDRLTVDREAIPLVDDGRVHHVRILMGAVRDVEKAEPSSVSGDRTVFTDSSKAPLPASPKSRPASQAAGRQGP